MVSFRCQLAGAKGCPGSQWNILAGCAWEGVSTRDYIWISSLSAEDHPHQSWRASWHLLRAFIDQKAEEGRVCSLCLSWDIYLFFPLDVRDLSSFRLWRHFHPSAPLDVRLLDSDWAINHWLPSSSLWTADCGTSHPACLILWANCSKKPVSLSVCLSVCIYTKTQIFIYIYIYIYIYMTPPVAQLIKNLTAMKETQVWSLGQEDALKKEMATHSSFLAWRTPWTDEPGGLQSVGVTKSWTGLSD